MTFPEYVWRKLETKGQIGKFMKLGGLLTHKGLCMDVADTLMTTQKQETSSNQLLSIIFLNIMNTKISMIRDSMSNSTTG